MKNEIVIKAQTELQKQEDVFSDFVFSMPVNVFLEKERISFLKLFSFGTGILNTLMKLKSVGDNVYIAELSSKDRTGLKNGSLAFDKSRKIEGNFAPNLRDQTGKKIASQITLKKEVNFAEVFNAIDNMAKYQILAGLSAQLEGIAKTLGDVYHGQMDDRLAEVLGSFNNYMMCFSYYQSEENKRWASLIAADSISKGIAKLHLHIDYIKQKINDAPENKIKAFKLEIKTPPLFKGQTIMYQNYFRELEINLINYNRLLMLYDIILINLNNNSELIKENHKKMEHLYKRNFNDKFIDHIRYITNNNNDKIEMFRKLRENSDNIIKAFENKEIRSVSIEYKSEELIKLLKNYGTAEETKD